ncbi:MAG: chitobiase/beta-hexosaminidase C-terminal domain-containing protein, partial [Bryobacteraceae bacterium]|nr:chitobiase/beta-hexosaminidase C-terminal domain-containing protein [Bryobacteraceae bacterium]
LGLIPEPELQERMRPGGVWQTTAQPVIEPAGGRYPGPVEVRMRCPTEGASIAWTTEVGDDASWELYTRPILLERSARVRAKACRLGWHDSPEAVAEFVLGA